MQISRATGTAGSGGTTPTARPHEVGTPAFGGSVEMNNTTQAGTTTVLHEDSFNVRVGWVYTPEADERFVISPSGVLVLELPVAPGDALDVKQSVVLEEIGG